MTRRLSTLLLLAAAASISPIVASTPATAGCGPMRCAPKVQLTCENPGTHQDVAKTPSIINTTSQSVPKGTTISWSATDGDKGSVTLSKPLPPQGEITVLGSPGQVYTCKAWFYKSTTSPTR